MPAARPAVPRLALLASLTLAAACADDRPEVWESPDVAEADHRGGAPYLEVARDTAMGSYVTDRDGRPLYLFEPDSAGASTCYDACAQAWPPLVAEAQPTADDPLDDALVGILEREDGQNQVTYGGWPLYYYVADTTGTPSGQDVMDHGGEWYLVTPGGEPLHAGG